MSWFRAHKILSWALGGYAALVLFALIASSGGSSQPSLLTGQLPSTSTPSASSQVTPAQQFERPNFEQQDCRSLLTTDEVDQALDDTNWVETSRGESCLSSSLGDSGAFVQIGPGHPTDFDSGAELIGVTGEPVSQVGDLALWFGGPQAEGDGTAGVLTVAHQTPLGALVFRVVLSRPDLASPQQLELATTLALAALPRFPGVALEPPPPPDPIAVTFDHALVDQSNQSFLANLLAREADREWTHGEGLVATLRYFAGELDATEVLRHPDLLDDSGTAIVRLARAYLEGGGDPAYAAEIERLLDLLPAIDPQVVTAGTEARAPESGLRSMALLASQEADDDVCYSVYPDHGNPCFKVASVDFPQLGDKYVIWFPNLATGEEWEGWTKGPSTIQNAIVKSALQLESMSGTMPRVAVWLTPYDGGSVINIEPGLCSIHLHSGAQALRDQDPKLLQQAIASAMARCYTGWNFGISEGGLLDWWEEAVSWYLSDVIYPDASMELLVLKIPQALQNEELSTTLTDRFLTSMTFFEYLDVALGLEGTMAATQTLATSGLASVPGIDDHLHEYNKALTDGVIIDQAGAHSYGPPSDFTPLSDGVTITANPQPFGLERIRVTVDSGQYACLEYPDAGNLDIIASWREGAPGESGSWTTQLPSSIQGQGVFLLTTTEPGGQFRIQVTDTDDEPDCSEDEDSSADDTPGPPCGFCDPTEFFWKWTIAGID